MCTDCDPGLPGVDEPGWDGDRWADVDPEDRPWPTSLTTEEVTA